MRSQQSKRKSQALTDDEFREMRRRIEEMKRTGILDWAWLFSAAKKLLGEIEERRRQPGLFDGEIL